MWTRMGNPSKWSSRKGKKGATLTVMGATVMAKGAMVRAMGAMVMAKGAMVRAMGDMVMAKGAMVMTMGVTLKGMGANQMVEPPMRHDEVGGDELGMDHIEDAELE